MNSIPIVWHQGEAYPSVVANVSIDSFGTQIIALVRETSDGRVRVIAETLNDEGCHFGPKEIIQWACGVLS